MFDEPDPKPLDVPAATAGTEGDIACAATLREIDQLQNHKASWANALLVLAITVGLFLALGTSGFDWQSLLLVCGILFIHELGHMAAMWLFRYRNLRMFFIPFFGAAVTGQNYNVPGWKKAIVSLMGPVPGIVLGVGLGIAGLIYSWPELLKASLLLLGLNALNLLPVLPLDGGWILHAVLFSRHPVLDVAFRLIASLILLLAGLAGMWLLALIGFGMLMGLPMSYRVAQVVRRLRTGGLEAISPDARTIPEETAKVIIHELRDALPANVDAKNTARLTLQVFESLNARPPGWLASLALLGLQVGSLVVAIVFGLVLFIAQHANLRDFVAAAAAQPRHAVHCRNVLTWQGAEAVQAMESPVNTIIADFATREKAEPTYRELVGRLPPPATATLFGQTLLVTLPATDDAAREQWLNELQGRCPGVFVAAGDFAAPFALSCIAPSAEVAKAIEEEVQMYVQMPGPMNLVPPWAPKAQLSDDQRKARRTYAQIQERIQRTYSDERLMGIDQKALTALRRGDKRAQERLAQERRQTQQELKEQSLHQIRKEGEAKWDLAVVDLYEKCPAQGAAEFPDEEEDLEQATAKGRAAHQEYERWLLQCGQRLGQLPIRDGKPAAGSSRYSSQTGMVTRAGLLLHFNWLQFVRPSDGAPALAKWLADQGCVDLKYEFHSGFGPEE